MRRARYKPDRADHFYHVYNRTVGMPGDIPFRATEKAHFFRLLKRLSDYYVIEVVSFVIMGNHYHLKVHVPREIPGAVETCRRYERHHRGRKHLSPGTPECDRIALMLRDLSCFMHDLQQQFAVWFNGSRVPGQRRRGPLWADRFKSIVYSNAAAVWRCLLYQMMNPVRASIVGDPAEYRFSCWGLWCHNGWHPFRKSVEARLIPYLRFLIRVETLQELRIAVQQGLKEMLPGA
jgi:putative transposase